MVSRVEDLESRQEMLITTQIKETEEYVYYNAYMVNQTNRPINFVYNDDRPQPIIGDPLKYNWKGALLRFTLSAYLLPKAIFIPGAWVITFVRSGVAYSAPLLFVPSTQYTQYPSQLIMNINQLLIMINDAFLVAYTAAGITSLAGAPFMIYNSSTQLFTIITDTVNYSPSGSDTVTPTQIFFNFSLNSLLGSAFPYFIMNPPPFTNCNVAIDIINTGNNINTPGIPPLIYQYAAYSETPGSVPVEITIPTYNTTTIESPLNSIQQINRIIVRDNSKMGIRTQAYGSNIVSEANNLLFNIIEDFIFPPVDRSLIEYTALPVRYFNMLGDFQFNQVAFSVDYMDSNLQTYPVQIIPGSISEFKFQFIKQYRSTTPRLLSILIDYFTGNKIDKSKKLSNR